ncbi:MAG: hypothetical protein PHV95_09135 [Eubacteriales bacterium]|nr:hypothetical protein [Eubacteriales bacterium]MDD4475931.1 hypothetical protein [Eubacteriales bacterium]
MTVKIKVSYESDQEKDRILRALQPVLGKTRMKGPKTSGNGQYKVIYIQAINSEISEVLKSVKIP